MKVLEIFHLINLSQKDIADEIGVTESAISGWIKNDSIPKARHQQLLKIITRHHAPISEDDLNPTIVQTNIKALKPDSITSPTLSEEEIDKLVKFIQLTYEHHFKNWNDHKTIPTPSQMVEAFINFIKDPPVKYRPANLSEVPKVKQKSQLKSPEVNLSEVTETTF